nr:OTU domain-containing protein 5 [Pelodiscus sinensis]|eukprot:XP_025035607.1 OTU domain-containing protein 5 [Pelodiscus sinensis]
MKNADYFSNYVTEDFTTYINRKRKNNCHGNHIEMQAMAEMYNRPVEVYQYGTGRGGRSLESQLQRSSAPQFTSRATALVSRAGPWLHKKQHLCKYPCVPQFPSRSVFWDSLWSPFRGRARLRLSLLPL